jgi:hypothetical protein
MSAWTFEDFTSDLSGKHWGQYTFLGFATAMLAEYGVVHIIEGYHTISYASAGEVGSAMNALMPASDTDYSLETYPVDTERIILQHGINQVTAGAFSFIAMWAVLDQWAQAPLFVLVPLLYDVGFFTAVEIPGYATPFQMAQAWAIATAMGTSSFWTWWNNSGYNAEW